LLLPWLAVLGLLALRSNRNAQAWWICAPLAVLALLGAGVESAFDVESNDGLGFIVQAAGAAAFGLAAIWLLGEGLARRGRALSMVLMMLAFAAVSLLAFIVSPAGEQLRDLSRWVPLAWLYLVLFWLTGGLAYGGALNLAGRMCRKRFSRPRVSWLLLLSLWLMWLAAGALLGGVATLASGDHFEWSGLLVAPLAFALVSFVVILPFLILSFTCSFYHERLKGLLRLPAPDALPPATPAPVADREAATL
jgi:hypothetical protein